MTHPATHRPVEQQPSARQGRNPLVSGPVWRIVLGIGLCAPQFAVLTFATVFLHDFGRLGLAGISAAMVTLQLGAMVMRVERPSYRPARQPARVFRADRYSSRPARSRCSQPRRPAMRTPLAAIVAILVFAGICVSAWHGVAYTEPRRSRARIRRAPHSGWPIPSSTRAVRDATAIPPLLAVSSWSVVWLAAALVAGATYPLFAAK